ncbi:MAG: GNAT family N-acetyltransferase [Steroidobacteraceae bacterium]
MTVRIARSLADVDARQWNALVGRGAPFLRHEFLLGLEQSGCATPETGWDAHHLLLTDARGRLTGAMPLYLKAHSWGEFVFDFAWADAYRRAGMNYYPRLVCAVPFTPATGPRLLVQERDGPATRRRLIDSARELARSLGVSSLHLLFAGPEDRAELEAAGLMPRLDCQFHWRNDGYGTFDDFLAGFTAEKRKKLRRERRRIAESGITHRTAHGAELDDCMIETVYRLHARTFAHFGNLPYLNLAFFRHLAQAMPRALVVELAMLGGEVVACSVSLRGDDALYGRYWGANGEYHSLHFETCFYRGIEYCIREGLARFEPGTQGEHKLLRGFAPAPVWSLHDIANPRFAAAIREWLERDRAQRRAYLRAAAEHLPFRRADIPARLPADVRDCLAAED